jgi:PAS domain S-box-containing protein
MTDKMDRNEKGNSNSPLRDDAADKLGSSEGLASELKDKTPEKIIHELRVHQIELEIQNQELKRVQLALEESKDELQDLYDFAPVGYFTLSKKGIIRDVNLTGASLLGMHRPKLIGRGFGRFVAPEAEGQWYDCIMSVLEQEEKRSCDLTLNREDGSSFSAHLESIRTDAPVEPADVSEGAYVVRMAVIDITERKRSEDQIKLNESRLQSLYDISQYRAKNNQDFLDFALDSAIRLTGSQVGYIYHYDADKRQFILNTWSNEVMKQCEVAEPQTVYALERTGIWGEAVRQKKAIILNDFQAPNQLKQGYPSGHVELLKFMTAPIFQNDKIVAVVGVANKKSDYDDSDVRQLSLLMDSVWRIIDRRQAEEQEKLLSTAVVQAAESVIITDASGIIQYVNPAQEKISGYSSAELIGQTPNIFKSDQHSDDFHSHMWESIKLGEVWSGRFINKKKDGTEYHEDATISPVYDKSGKLTNFVSVKRDVTKETELQEQLFHAQKMEAVARLTAGLAHDFNNLLQIILSNLDVILSEPVLPEKIRKNLGDIDRAGTRGAELVKQMLVYGRKVPFKLRPVNLARLVAQVTPLLAGTFPAMIKMEIVTDRDLWAVNCDPTQMDQALINLAINARDAMPEGGKLSIRTQNIVLDEEFNSYPGMKPGLYVLLSVTDTGTGMDPEIVKHIFEPFFTTKEVGKGTGLGLSVVYGIVEKHGGRIICFSEPSEGTTFRIYLPAIEEIPEEQYSGNKEPPKGRGETILLVDDEPHLLDIVSRQLVGANYKMITASNGKEALNLYKQQREQISLVILDLLMPEIGRKHCLEALRDIDPNVRVLIASGALNSAIEEDLHKIGAEGLIAKPFDITQLLEKIRKIIDEE